MLTINVVRAAKIISRVFFMFLADIYGVPMIDFSTFLQKYRDYFIISGGWLTVEINPLDV